jgi:hypothetical protein
VCELTKVHVYRKEEREEDGRRVKGGNTGVKRAAVVGECMSACAVIGPAIQGG